MPIRKLAFFSLLLLAACPPAPGDTDSGTDTATDTDADTSDTGTSGTSDTSDTGLAEYTATLGPDGGALDAGAVQLVFPPGALLEDTDITVVEVPAPDPDFVPGTTFAFYPGGLVFEQPVSAVFAYDPPTIPVEESELGVAWYAPDDDVFQGELVVHHPDDDLLVAHLRGFAPQPAAQRAGTAVSYGVVPEDPGPIHLAAELDPPNNGNRSARLTWDPAARTYAYGTIDQARVVPGGTCECATQLADGSVLPVYGCVQPLVDANGDQVPDDAAHDGQCLWGEQGVYTGLQRPADRPCAQINEVDCWRPLTGVTLGDGMATVGLSANAAVYWYRIRQYNGTRYYSPPSTDLARLIVFGPNDPPGTPRFVDALPLPCGGIRLTWTSETTSGALTTASTYRLSRKELSPNPDPYFVHLVDLGAYEMSYTFRNAEPGARYAFRLVALNRNTATGGEQQSASVTAYATNADTEFDLDVSPNALGIVPGDSAWADVTLTRHVGPLDVDVAFETSELCAIIGAPGFPACLEVFAPGVIATDAEQVGFALHAETPVGTRIAGQVTGTAQSTAGTRCAEPMLLVAASSTPHPVPRIGSLAPVEVTGGTGASPATVAVIGSGFYQGSQVWLDDVPHATTYVTTNELDFTLSGDELLSDPSNPFVNVTVVNPTPGGGQSNFALLVVTGWDPPAITGISPSQVPYSTTPDFDLTVIGSGFMAGSEVQMNAAPLTTTVASDTEVHATVHAADLLRGANTIQVLNPVPALGTSNTVDLFATTLDCATVPAGEACISVVYGGGCETGMVDSTPAGISCTNGFPNAPPEGSPAGCHATFAQGTVVGLQASNSSDCRWIGWSGCPSEDGKFCLVPNLQVDTTVTALWEAY